MKYTIRESNSIDIIERIFENRGVSIEQRDTFLKPSRASIQDPRVYDNMEKAVDLYLAHIKNGSNILIVVDTDCDGYCSNSIFYNYTKEVMEHDNINYIMHNDRAHGLTEDIMNKVLDIRPDLLVVIDAGSNDYAQHETLFNSGISIIVLDHHECEGYSDFALVVNNQLSKEGNKTLSGGGMVMKFMELADEKSGKCGAEDYIDLVGVSLVADVMLMTEEETRYYVLEGLDNITNPLLSILTEQTKSFNFNTIGFEIAPVFNSIIRVGDDTEKRIMFEALIGVDRLETLNIRGKGDVELTLPQYISKIASRMKSRQTKLIKKVVESESTTIITDDLPITFMIHEDDDGQGLSGLIASKLVDKYKKPAIVLKKNEEKYYHGSARSTGSIPNLRDILIDTGKFMYCLGHSSAFGCSIGFKQLSDLLHMLITNPSNMQSGSYIVDKAYTDGNVSAMDIISIGELKDYWCKGFEEPKFYIKLSNISGSDVIVMGANANTIKITNNFISYIKFSCDSDIVKEFKEGSYDIEIIGKFNLNEWNGRSYPQVIIEDYKITHRDNFDDVDFNTFNPFGGM